MKTKTCRVGSLNIGGENKISLQTMYSESILDKNTDEIVNKIYKLKKMGCSLLRFSYVNLNEKEKFKEIITHSPLPLVADVHFDYRLALSALDLGFDGIRINPGNIGKMENVEKVVKSARDNNKALRIGLNSASLPRDINRDNISEGMVNLALEYLDDFEKWGFQNTIVSLKSSDEKITLEANKLFKSKSDYPLHVGLTEAGGVVESSVRSAIVLSKLLENGIGDTIRVSINGSMEDEIRAGREILRSLNLNNSGVRIVACPLCGRHSFDSVSFLNDIEEELYQCEKNITVAIMGCSVNGPGESHDADYAITGNGKKIFIYKNGEVYTTLPFNDLLNAKKIFLELINE